MFRRFLEESSRKPGGKRSDVIYYLKQIFRYDLEKHGSDEDVFCVIRWADRTAFDIVNQRNVRAAPDSILVYETYTVEMDGKQRKGTVILKGIFCFQDL